MNTQQFLLKHFPRLHVNRGKRFIHQHYARVRRYHTRHANPLPHTTRQLIGIPLFKPAKPDEFDHFLAYFSARRRTHSATTKAELDVGTDRQPLKERSALKDNCPIRTRRVYWPTVKRQVPGSWSQEAGYQIK